MKTSRRLLTGSLALGLLASACVSDDTVGQNDSTRTTDLSGENIILTSGGLTAAQSCGSLLDALVAEGVEQVGPYGFGQGGYWGFPGVMEDMAIEDSAETTMADSGGSDRAFAETSGAIDGDFSGTNNQEVDVDEADIVKTDGKRLVVLNGNTVRVIDTSGAEPRLERTIELGDDLWASEMFLVGDKALLMTQGWTEVSLATTRESDRIGFPQGSPTVKIVEVDLARGDVGQAIEFEGAYLSAREVDGTIRVVLSAQMGQFPFLFPSNPAAEETAEEANRRLVEESTIDQWLPSFRITENGDVVDSGRAVDCERMHLPADFSGFGSLTVLTVSVDNGLAIDDSIGVVSDGQTVYASTDRLTVATSRWPEWDPQTGQIKADEDFSTSLHTFDITDTGRTDYVGSGEVRGHLLSQYSLSEADGYLRVATTEGDPWGGTDSSESFVSIFDEQGGELVQVGQVGGLGKGERIFSVRFMGDTAYVVTFRQVDPLYTVDLSDPTDPTVLGELKIPGFSTYLHPVGDDLLIGVGQDATDEGVTTGAQVSLFDVADLSNPQRIDQFDLGQNSYSSVEWDPKAFLYWQPEQLVSVPVSAWAFDDARGVEENTSGAQLLTIDDRTLIDLGRIGHPVTRDCETGIYVDDLPIDGEASDDAEAEFARETQPAPPADEYCWSYQPEIRRAVIIGDVLYTVSEAGVKANDLDSLRDIAWIPFTR
jgi:hypothetical protein